VNLATSGSGAKMFAVELLLAVLPPRSVTATLTAAWPVCWFLPGVVRVLRGES